MSLVPRDSIRAQLAKLNGQEEPSTPQALRPGQVPYAVVSLGELPAEQAAEDEAFFATKMQRAAERAAHATQPAGTQYLYRCYNAEENLLYVGITDNPPRRWKEHKSSTVWWPEVAATRLETWPTRSAVERAEAATVKAENPRYNKTLRVPTRRRTLT